jgi:hypothetical protein
VLIIETPAFAESISDGDIKWDKDVGDAVAEDEQVGEIETDKVRLREDIIYEYHSNSILASTHSITEEATFTYPLHIYAHCSS